MNEFNKFFTEVGIKINNSSNVEAHTNQSNYQRGLSVNSSFYISPIRDNKQTELKKGPRLGAIPIKYIKMTSTIILLFLLKSLIHVYCKVLFLIG